MKVFIAGVMRGSRTNEGFKPQEYRKRIRLLIKTYIPDAEIFDPLERCGIEESNSGDDRRNKLIYLDEINDAKEADLIIAYLPEASMGTAVEMWEAYKEGKTVVTISQMVDNWTVKFLSTKIYRTLHQFEYALQNGLIQECII